MTKKKKKVVVKKGFNKPHNYKGHVREFRINGGLPEPQMIREELKGYRDVLQARELPPIQKGVMTLMECGEAYFSRACAIEQDILEAQAEGHITKDSPYHSLRTQEIRSYKEMFKSAAELGSRRITYESLRVQQEIRGMESA